ncbi:MAG: cobalamin B12-binding domain-containing protein [Acidobacteria bacterium]|nr:cobalamin B12-binding domain-containing protein [Acidobacteriota bacterium]MBI3655498.1 cobalamin B12-binding domain-containing protein [Acidobacteriota bacterium]
MERDSLGATKKSSPTRISIICSTGDIYCIGPRRFSSQRKRHGFEVDLIFLRATTFWGQSKRRFNAYFDEDDLSESVYQQLLDICRDSAIVGFSVWTHQVEQVTRVTRRLQKELSSLIIWGGIHPTSFPEESLQVVEAICMGEGEVSFLQLAQAVREGRDYKKARGFWFREGGKLIRNREQPLVNDLDDFPFLDFEYEAHFIDDQGKL